MKIEFKDQETRKRVVSVAIFFVFVLPAVINCFKYAPPIEGKVIDARTKAPIKEVSIRYEWTAVWFISDSGSGREWLIDKSFSTDKNSVFLLPSQKAFTNPLMVLESQRININKAGYKGFKSGGAYYIRSDYNYPKAPVRDLGTIELLPMSEEEIVKVFVNNIQYWSENITEEQMKTSMYQLDGDLISLVLMYPEALDQGIIKDKMKYDSVFRRWFVYLVEWHISKDPKTKDSRVLANWLERVDEGAY